MIHVRTLPLTLTVLFALGCSGKEDAPVAQGAAGAPASGGTGGSGGSGGGTAGGATTGGSAGVPGGFAGSPSRPVVDPLPCFGDDGSPAGSDIDLQLVPSRISGVAPLSIHFDTVGTTATATTRPFHELAYCWDFGDPDSGSFATTGLTKNQARGPLAGHVFETPGNYTVTVSARDADGLVATQAVDIVVDDPDSVFAGAATVCLSGSGDFEGCPDGATQVTGSSLADFDSYMAPGMRLLLHRGESFDGNLRLNAAGPGHIGPYGSAQAAPLIMSSGMVFTISFGENPLFDDWRVVDLDFEGADENSEIAYVEGLAFNFLLLRARARNLGASVRANDATITYWNMNGPPGQDIIDGLTIQDCDVRDISGTATGGNLLGVVGHRVMLLGNVFQNSTRGEHIWRLSLLDRAVIGHNDLGEAPQPRHLIKMHGSHFDQDGIGRGKYTERILIADNIFRGTGGHGWSVALGPENDQSDERLRDILVERNLFLPGDGAQVALMLWGTNMTARNNLMNRGIYGGCIGGGRRGIEPPSDQITIMHNTCYNSSEAPSIASFDASSTNVRVFNNLCASPAANADCGMGGVTEGAGNIATVDGAFANSDLMTWEDFELTAASPGIDGAAADNSTTWDYAGRARPIDGDGSGTAEPDVGAMEYEP